MTTIGETRETCMICHRSSEHTVIYSTNRFGAPDLDTRPPEMMRSTMPHWIRCCPHCGYCAPEISKGPQQANEVTKSEAYQQQLKNPSFPWLANHFLCWAMIEAAGGNYPSAGMDCLHAAWACDDAHSPEAAMMSRGKAIFHFQVAKASGARLGGQVGIDEAILADLLRRTGRFDEAITVCQEGYLMRTEDILRKMFQYQMQLCRAEDRDCHTIDEVPGEG